MLDVECLDEMNVKRQRGDASHDLQSNKNTFKNDQKVN